MEDEDPPTVPLSRFGKASYSLVYALWTSGMQNPRLQGLRDSARARCDMHSTLSAKLRALLLVQVGTTCARKFWHPPIVLAIAVILAALR